ncbi:hypothetical protein C3F34_13915 [Acinetobacter sp. ACNIH2]|uniref:putative quorum-sensing-regulated virulence factor n=1 Tax=Acinetobacter sp. ACNIH2 TaxID=1758189 RepID=UPI000CDBE73B|nr:DUF3820 family protein [Acinetobacter sp. ACNIH2]AUX87018.1 hypothetical protein C3F34_13915 [Acinetobacter sp. ACNIH2]
MNSSSQVETIEVINFGKFKGTALVDLNHGYVNWLLEQETLNSNLRNSLEALPWVKEAQKRQKLAEVLQRTHIPSQDRRAYKKRMGWVGA